jgi:hypothetical protein
MLRQPAPVVGGAGSGPIASAAPAHVVANAAAGYRRWLRRRREQGEGEEVGRGGMRASDIGGVGGPAATPGPGRSPQRHRLPLLPLPALLPGIGGGSRLIIYCQKKPAHGIHCRGSVVQPSVHYGQGTGFDTWKYTVLYQTHLSFFILV